MAEIVGSGRRRWWIPAAAVFVIVAVVVTVLVLRSANRGDGHPEAVAREFLDAGTCQQARERADDKLRDWLDARNCQIITDAAAGRRTYGDPVRSRHLTRDLMLEDVQIDGDRAQVTFNVRYSGQRPTPADERVVVRLERSGDGWVVDSWGLPH